MVKKYRLMELLKKLKDSAIARNTLQGIPIYEKGISQLSEAGESESFLGILSSISTALSGINAHGYFTDDEYKWVSEIWDMDKD